MVGLSELSKKFAKRSGYTEAESRNLIMQLVYAIEDSIIESGTGVQIRDHMTLEIRKTKAHTIEHPVTGEPCDIPEKYRLGARAGKRFSQRLNGKL